MGIYYIMFSAGQYIDQKKKLIIFANYLKILYSYI